MVVDVTHFWPLNYDNGEDKLVNQNWAKLRSRVSALIHRYGYENHWNVEIGIKGRGIQHGRREVHSSYVSGMLGTKIIVVTQRDRWEGHYRLFEAMVTGACVFSDFMYGLPGGLQNGTSILLFTGGEELKSLIQYYLDHPDERLLVARRGREIAMTRHRSWHRMEEIVFGEILTTCSSLADNPDTNCPYIVHASDA
mmetsp:Transcript_36187/g.75264  ORF Transcript_36187/g.75264 Transcript_36187/m.75264 type:complete len:196 (-) Transcript_36187:2168-2755(-)